MTSSRDCGFSLVIPGTKVSPTTPDMARQKAKNLFFCMDVSYRIRINLRNRGFSLWPCHVGQSRLPNLSPPPPPELPRHLDPGLGPLSLGLVPGDGQALFEIGDRPVEVALQEMMAAQVILDLEVRREIRFVAEEIRVAGHIEAVGRRVVGGLVPGI